MKLIGLDIGTTSLCGISCDAATGQIVQTITEQNGTFLPAAEPWEKQQDAAALVARLRRIAAALAADGDVAAVGLTGQMHGIVYLAADGQPVGPLTIWQDGRGDLPYRDGKSYAEWLSAATGYPLATGYGAVTHFYATVNGLIPPGAVTFCTIHDLCAMALTGRKTPLLDPSDAASIGLFSLARGQFDTAAIRAAGMDPAFFPDVSSGHAALGRTSHGVPVAVAIGDNQASVLGSVQDLAHSVLVNVGTGSQISCAVPQAAAQVTDGRLELRPLTDDLLLLTGSSLCGGRAYAILERALRDIAAAVTGQPVESAYPAMDRLMADYRPNGSPLTVDTAFCGTRSDPQRRGSITGIGIDNFTMAALCDGVMNGIVSELHGLYAGITPLLPQRPVHLIGSGNGIRHNAPLAARFSAAFGLPLSVPAHREEAAFGAALFAAVAAGAVPDLAAAQSLIRYLDR